MRTTNALINSCSFFRANNSQEEYFINYLHIVFGNEEFQYTLLFEPTCLSWLLYTMFWVFQDDDKKIFRKCQTKTVVH